MRLGERQLIASVFSRARSRDDIAVGIGDDAAVTCLAPGMQLVSATDAIVADVHFPPQLTAAQIGYRALAVNLSDLAAMGAEPLWCLLTLCCPHGESDWYAGFAEGFFSLADRSGIELIGGDLVSGPLTVSVTVLGQVPHGTALLRSGATVGDLLYVTGAPGAAAAGLAALEAGSAGEAAGEFVTAFVEPRPRLQQGLTLRGLASAAIDLSDGLLGDARQLAAASQVSLRIEPAELAHCAAGGDIEGALRGGDDYELLFTLPVARRAEFERHAQDWDCAVTAIGAVTGGRGVQVPGFDVSSVTGYEHFGA